MKRKYTKEIHAKLLLTMLKKENPYSWCPSILHNKLYFDADNCVICTDFIGLSLSLSFTANSCPCSQLGKKEAIKRTWLALEQKGYLS